MQTAGTVLAHGVANAILKQYEAQGGDAMRLAEGIAKRLNEKLEEKYRRMTAAMRSLRQSDMPVHKVLKGADGFELRKLYDVPDWSYHYWGQRLGYECWEDKQFVEEFLRDNPECRAIQEKVTVITPGMSFGK